VLAGGPSFRGAERCSQLEPAWPSHNGKCCRVLRTIILQEAALLACKHCRTELVMWNSHHCCGFQRKSLRHGARFMIADSRLSFPPVEVAMSSPASDPSSIGLLGVAEWIHDKPLAEPALAPTQLKAGVPRRNTAATSQPASTPSTCWRTSASGMCANGIRPQPRPTAPVPVNTMPDEAAQAC
jgi:hypothetical protein